MDTRKLFFDERLKGLCAYCGAAADSRDHVPSRILLDEPYPDNLPIAESCTKCNQGFSVAEEYFACLLECVIQGTITPNESFREKILATLLARPTIGARIEKGKQIGADGSLVWMPETDPVREVVLKLARGHLTYELGLQRTDDPIAVEIMALPLMSEQARQIFFSLENEVGHLYPEIGSRAFANIASGKPTAYDQWQVVQEGRYAYAVGQSAGDWAKMFIGDYLVCRVAWD
jgi:hypothetical protein